MVKISLIFIILKKFFSFFNKFILYFSYWFVSWKVFNRKESTFSHYDKIFGRKLSVEELVHGLALFYQFHESTPQIRAIVETIRRFEEIMQWFLKQKTYHFYASSLIVVYDAINDYTLNGAGDNNDPINNNNNMSSPDSIRVIMADFAHVFPANNSLDLNYIYGLERCIEHLKLLLKPDYKFKDVRVGR